MPSLILRHVRNSTDATDGLYMSRDGMTMSVLEISYWEELDSSAIPLYGKYNVQSGHVDLDNPDANLRALRSYGWKIGADGIESDSGETVAAADTEAYWLCLADALWSHGCKSVACDVSGNNLRKLVKQARNAL